MSACRFCKTEIGKSTTCPHCGAPQYVQAAGVPGYSYSSQQPAYAQAQIYGNTIPVQQFAPISPLNRTVTLLLAIFFGYIGVHRFYAGKLWTGILMILTAGGLGIWWLIDVIVIAFGSFRDKSTLLIRRW